MPKTGKQPSSVLILVNPRAREGAVETRWPELEAELLEALGENGATVVFTSDQDHGSATVRKAIKSGTRKVVVVGGDGTVSEAVQGFFESDRPETPIARDAVLIIMPGGKGDDFFKIIAGGGFYRSSEAWTRGLELLRNGSPKDTDLGLIEFLSEGASTSRDSAGKSTGCRYFINIASFGFPGMVVDRVLSKSGWLGQTRLGAWTYLAQAAAALTDYQPLLVEVRVDERTLYNGPVFSGFVMNGAFNAGGACWSNEAKVDDGILDILVLEPRSVLQTVLTVPKFLSGSWKSTAGVHCGRGQRIEILAKDPSDSRGFPLFEVDGDQPERSKTYGARIRVLSSVLRVWR